MDILNWLYLAKNKFVRTTLSSTKDLMIFGANVGFSKRGDKYQNYAMSAEDFTTEVGNVVKPYKVYTALLTQSGGDDPNGQYSGTLIIGATYLITDFVDGDFISVGAPNNNTGTYFVATGTTPNWGTSGDNIVSYNTGAPVVTVLENTIGNVYWLYGGEGYYTGNLTDGFIGDFFFQNDRVVFFSGSVVIGQMAMSIYKNDDNQIGVDTFKIDGTYVDSALYNVPIEIRVYN